MPNTLNLSVQNLHFDYGLSTKIFENHSLELAAPVSQNTKLYGIIGPSGVGKTTLLSILGGQLRPSGGQVLVMGTDINAVDDLERRRLIGLQIQTATSLRGTLSYNLLFGLPKTAASEPIFADEILIKTLKQVGLWNLFAPKQGLETLIGEGGLNLSGGQRQRLNFASLYLRAKFFEPSLILIDEPTSSLDEISEQQITKMILDLAQKALTIVIAHRLKTLENSVGILDLSLSAAQKNLEFLTKSQLRQKSTYYQKLLSGELTLDE